MTLVKRSVKGSKLTIMEMDGNLDYLESLGVPQNIVNDLTTGGLTKALSAEQGKVLQNAKMNRLTNGNGAIDINVIMTLVGLGFDLSNADLSYADLPNANLPYANLSNANLSNAYLESADFTGANLPNADLSYAHLPYANLSNAYLESANFTSANFTDANLSNAYLESANFTSANFTDANFSSATGLNANINIALADVNKDPNGNGIIWTLTWTDSLTYSCDPSTGLFTLAS